ncbi:Uncharacterised protein [uncultured archaeon]|nr:Uncharacterised protein [uncultured archaeon]
MQSHARFMLILILTATIAPLLMAQEVNVTLNLTSADNGTTAINPWAADGRLCGFINTFIKTPVFVVIFLAFLLGIAIVSFGAFPEWRDHGSKLILGSVGAAVLYILGTFALRYLLQTSICGL